VVWEGGEGGEGGGADFAEDGGDFGCGGEGEGARDVGGLVQPAEGDGQEDDDEGEGCELEGGYEEAVNWAGDARYGW
jgi:hypothetical protein